MAPVEPSASPADSQPDRASEVAGLLRAATPRAWVTPAIVAVLIACFAGEVALGVHPLEPTTEQLLRAGAGFGPMLVEGQWWRLLTSTLLHGGLVHLGFNLWALWSAGQFTERIFGNLAFAALYLLSALGGSLLSAALHPLVVSVGASGAIFGVYGALLAFVLTHRGVFPPEILRQQRNSLAAFLLYNVVFGLADPRIDLAGHAGGLLTGLAAGWLLRRDLRRPSEHVRRRVQGAAALALLLAVGAWGVRLRVERVPVVRAQLLAERGLAALRAGDPRRAVEHYTAALALVEEASWLHNRGLARVLLREPEAALPDLSRALELSPGGAKSLRLRGETLFQLGRLEDAERDCAELWKMPGLDPVPASFCAAVAIRRGDSKAALERAGRVLEKQPEHVGALRIRSNSRQAAGDLDGALADLDHVLRLEPDNASALNSRGWFRIERGDFAAGLEDAERSLALRPDDGLALGTRCFALAGLGKREAARRDCARAAELIPDDLVDQGMIAFLDGRRAEALSRWSEAGRRRAADARSLRPWMAKAQGR
ncbi:MAG TPA: rhomboid family intramembrane serine protease [Anaeromyxobacteraceae bacterium]|nr:rhomboid family intramembrane serine protease [Anaeromyxobacteraceae bacterium]